jgi:hypothetical protein
MSSWRGTWLSAWTNLPHHTRISERIVLLDFIHRLVSQKINKIEKLKI